MSSVSNGMYFLTLPLVSVMRVIYRKIRHARYLYIKRNVEKVWGARYTLGARYLLKNTVFSIYFNMILNIVFVTATFRSTTFQHTGSNFESPQILRLHYRFTQHVPPKRWYL